MIETATRPCGPYSLRLSARLATDATRTFRSGRLSAVLPGGELACAWQNPDGVVVVRAESEAGIERMRFVLGLEDDHSEFLERFADDPVIGRTTCVLKGLRPLRLATVAHSLLRALAGQLVTWQHAKEIERDVIRRTTARHACGLHEPPTGESLGRVGTADLRKLGLHARRAAVLVRLCRSVDLVRLHALPPGWRSRRQGLRVESDFAQEVERARVAQRSDGENDRVPQGKIPGADSAAVAFSTI